MADGIHVMNLPLGHYHSGKKTLLDMVRFFFRSLYCTFVLTCWIVRHRPHLLFANGPQDLHLCNARRLDYPSTRRLASAQRAAKRCRTLSTDTVLPMGAYHRGMFPSCR